jgi:hypothetical protein
VLCGGAIQRYSNGGGEGNIQRYIVMWCGEILRYSNVRVRKDTEIKLSCSAEDTVVTSVPTSVVITVKGLLLPC